MARPAGGPRPSSSRTPATHEGPLLVVEDLHTVVPHPAGHGAGRRRCLLRGPGGQDPRHRRRVRLRQDRPVPLDHGPAPAADVIRSGTVHFAGHELTAMDDSPLREVWGAELSMIFQDPMTALNPVKRIGDQIGESLRLHLDMDKKEARSTAVELLRSVGIPSPEQRVRWYPFQLSGGMRQRVMIAIALACAPRLVMADEPTTGLDVTVQAQILDLLADLQRERHMAVILVTHDLGVVASRADDIIVMYAGRVVERAPTRTLFTRHQDALHPGPDGLHPPPGRPERCPPRRHRRAAARPDQPADGLPVRPPLPLRPGQVPRVRAAAAHRRLRPTTSSPAGTPWSTGCRPPRPIAVTVSAGRSATQPTSTGRRGPPGGAES